jgi:hypothetical protein
MSYFVNVIDKTWKCGLRNQLDGRSSCDLRPTRVIRVVQSRSLKPTAHLHLLPRLRAETLSVSYLPNCAGGVLRCPASSRCHFQTIEISDLVSPWIVPQCWAASHCEHRSPATYVCVSRIAHLLQIHNNNNNNNNSFLIYLRASLAVRRPITEWVRLKEKKENTQNRSTKTRQFV